MKKMIQMLVLVVMAVVLAVPAFARLNNEQIMAALQDDDDAKNELYTKVTTNISTNQPVAYEAAKEYLQKWPNDDDAIAKYLKDFVAKYDKAIRKQNCTKLIGDKKWSEAYQLCKQIVSEEPDSLSANLNISWVGMQLASGGNNSNNSEATNYSTRTIQIIESGKTIEPGKPYPEKDKQEAFGWLNYSLYLYNLNNKQVDTAVSYLIKAAQFENPFKNDPNTYLKLVAIYSDEFEKRRVDYSTRFDGQPKSPEGDAAFERVKQEADLLIDAIARAIAYSGTDPKTQQARDELKKTLTDYYKFRNNGSVDGIDALIAGIKSKPLPRPGDVVTPTPPATTTAPEPTGNATATDSKSVASTATTTPTTTKSPTTSTANQGTKQAGASEKKAMTSPAGTNGRRPKRR